jgi:mRNA-degrading endonuclease toxin of MazEF toxin-antitoxin module
VFGIIKTTETANLSRCWGQLPDSTSGQITTEANYIINL